MFETIVAAPPDAILGLTEAFKPVPGRRVVYTPNRAARRAGPVTLFASAKF